MIELKSGDKIIVRSLDWFEEHGVKDSFDSHYSLPGISCICFVKEMQEFCGKEVTVDWFDGDGDIYIREDNNNFLWIKEFFDIVYEEDKIVDYLTGLVNSISDYCDNYCVYNKTGLCNSSCLFRDIYVSSVFLPKCYNRLLIKPGDKVKIKSLEWFEKSSHIKESNGDLKFKLRNGNIYTFYKHMQEFCGEYVTVVDIISDSGVDIFKVDSFPDDILIMDCIDFSYIIDNYKKDKIYNYCNNSCVLGDRSKCNNFECPLYKY